MNPLSPRQTLARSLRYTAFLEDLEARMAALREFYKPEVKVTVDENLYATVTVTYPNGLPPWYRIEEE